MFKVWYTLLETGYSVVRLMSMNYSSTKQDILLRNSLLPMVPWRFAIWMTAKCPLTMILLCLLIFQESSFGAAYRAGLWVRKEKGPITLSLFLPKKVILRFIAHCVFINFSTKWPLLFSLSLILTKRTKMLQLRVCRKSIMDI